MRHCKKQKCVPVVGEKPKEAAVINVTHIVFGGDKMLLLDL